MIKTILSFEVNDTDARAIWEARLYLLNDFAFEAKGAWRSLVKLTPSAGLHVILYNDLSTLS
jgi:hypothetical protein